MKRRRVSLGRRLILWTIFLFAAAILLVGQAVISLYLAGQVCFLNYPSVPCPTVNDPAFLRINFALFGLPLVWLAGVGLAALTNNLRRRNAST